MGLTTYERDAERLRRVLRVWGAMPIEELARLASLTPARARTLLRDMREAGSVELRMLWALPDASAQAVEQATVQLQGEA